MISPVMTKNKAKNRVLLSQKKVAKQAIITISEAVKLVSEAVSEVPETNKFAESEEIATKPDNTLPVNSLSKEQRPAKNQKTNTLVVKQSGSSERVLPSKKTAAQPNQVKQASSTHNPSPSISIDGFKVPMPPRHSSSVCPKPKATTPSVNNNFKTPPSIMPPPGSPVNKSKSSMGPPTNVSMGPPTNASMGPPTNASMGPPTNASMGPPTNASMGPPTNASMGPPTNASMGPPTSASMGPPTNESMPPPSFSPAVNSISQLSRYVKTICLNLDYYQKTKKLREGSLLMFGDNESNLPLLNAKVARSFADRIVIVSRYHQNLDSMDVNQFNRVIQLMENTIVYASEIDVVVYHEKHPKDTDKLFDMLKMINYVFETCSILFQVVTSTDIGKKYISHNTISRCLHFIKNQLNNNLYPLLDQSNSGNNFSGTSSTYLFHQAIQSSPHKDFVSSIISHLVHMFPRLLLYISTEDLDDDMFTTSALISMGPFVNDCCVDLQQSVLLEQTENQENKLSPYEQLKFYALDILKHLFNKYPKHRYWIFEIILNNLGSITTINSTRRYQLRNNQTIHVMSALFMQLIQCSASINHVSSHKNWYRKWNIGYQQALKNDEQDKVKLLDDELLQRASTAWQQNAESAINSVSSFLEFLMSKCKVNRADMYSLQEYRAILELILQDIITVMNDPDWPVAELIIRILSRVLITLLEGSSSDQYLKSLAIEWLGTIAGKIKIDLKKLSKDDNRWVHDLNQKLPQRIDIKTDLASLQLLYQCRTRVLDYTKKEGIASSTTDFYLCHWGLLESNQWKKSNQGYEIQTAKMIDMPAINTVVPLKETDQTQDITLMQTSTANNDNTLAMEEDEAIDLKWPKKANTFLSEMCKYYWLSCIGVSSSLPSSDSMYAFPKLSRSDYTLLNELLASRQTLYTSCDLILSKLLVCLEKDAAIYRTKSLCAIGKIATEAPEVLEDKRINKMVIQRIHDTSPSVRDAAINVMSQYLNRLDTIPEPLYKIISARIMDTSLNVRIRVIELLSSLYFKFPDPQLKMNMAAKIILRIGDNEVSVSQLSLKTTQDILFMPFKQIEKDGNDYLGYSFADSPKQHKRKIVELTSIIIGAISKLDPFVAAQNAALSQIVEKTLSEADEKTKAWYQNIFQWIVDSLFERMVALDEEDSMAEFNHLLITVYSFTKSCPHLLRESHISILQPYISVTDQKADWTRIQYILTIYRDVLPSIKHHNLQFIQSTEKVVMQLLSRCPLNIISSGISCLCAIVNTISHQYNLLIRMLGSCIMKLKYVRQLITEGDIQDTKAFSGVLKMLTLTGLLGQHFEYDKRQKEKPAETEALNLVHHGDINALVFDALKFSTNDYTDDLSQNGIQMRLAALRGLGCSDASHPTFMISEESTRLIDTVFDQGTASLKRQLMLVFQEFLMAEGKRMNRCKKEAGMSLWSKQMDASMFLGNTKECVKLDVYRSLVQRYLKNILHCALSDSKDLSCAAFGVVSSVVYQDLAHPRSYMHTIVAAETSPDVTLCNKAYHLHQYAHDKYGSLLYTQMSECLMTSFDYQKQFVDHPTNLRGYLSRNGEAGAKIEPLLGLTFSILKKKKKAKFDFLLSLIKPFDFDLKNTSNEDIRLDYLKYLGENMMALNLARSDEVLHMVYVMDRILMTLGADLLCYVHSLKKKGIIQPIDPGEEEVNQPPKEPDRDLMIASKLCVAMFILIRVKILLLEVYGILDDEIRHYRPNSSTKGREITRNLDIQQCIDWNDLYYYRKGQNMCTLAAMDACLRFEHLLMNDTIASVIENT